MGTPSRHEFLLDHMYCMVCGSYACDVHEMARGCHRSVAVKHRCCWLSLCRQCHEEMDDYAVWPLTRQLAVKLLKDPEYFDLLKFNSIRGRAPGAITLAEVVAHLCMEEY